MHWSASINGGKLKILSENRILSMEPRGIKPLNPSVNHGVPHQRWPLGLRGLSVIFWVKKKARGISDFQDLFAIRG